MSGKPDVPLFRENPRIVLKELYAWVAKAIGDLGKSRQEARLRTLPPGQKISNAVLPVRFFEHELLREKPERDPIVVGRVRDMIRDLSYDLELRGADFSFGFAAKDVIHRGLFPDSPRHLGDYAVRVEWIGPVPATWPAPIVKGELSEAESEEGGREIERERPEEFAAASRIMLGTDAMVKQAAAEERKRTKVSRHNLRILRNGSA